MKYFWIVSLFIMLSLIWPAGEVLAQEPVPNYPVYVVQAGDNLWSIALRFGISLDELVQANQVTNLDELKVGDQLIIPGLEGITGMLVTQPVRYGDSLRALSLRYQVTEDLLARLNHVSSPQELFAGANLVLLQSELTSELGRRAWLAPGGALLEAAVSEGVNPWVAVLANQYAGSWQALPGEVIHLPGEAADAPSALPDEVSLVSINLPAAQGGTTVLQIAGSEELTLSGSLLEHNLNFFSLTPGEFVALQGVHAMVKPGIYPLELTLVRADHAQLTFSQFIYIEEVGYPTDPSLQVDPATIDPQVTRPEDAQWTALAMPVTQDKLWQGAFVSPVAPDYTDCITSSYGNRRSYNDGPYDFFHTGLDFCGQVGHEIFAPANGVVVFAGELTVRGKATMIDHGWGVYTAYMHQSEILVQAGDQVLAGQRIGLVGATGRVSGPHLHWEIWVGGVQVNPSNWLEQAYP